MSREPNADARPDARGEAARVEALAHRLEDYQRRYERARDSRAVFAFAYRNLTLDLADRLAGDDHGFDDPAWVADLALAFGDRYVAAMDAIDAWRAAGAPESALYDRAPRPWADVYLAIEGRSLVVEDLVFAIGAHISHDLPLALGDVDRSPGRLADYHEMNAVLADNTDHVQSAVERRYSHFLRRLDRLLAATDELLTGYAIRTTRSVAWYNAARLAHPPTREAAHGSIDRAVAGLIDGVRAPDAWWLRAGSRVLRTLARHRRWPEPAAPADVASGPAAPVDVADGSPRTTDTAGGSASGAADVAGGSASGATDAAGGSPPPADVAGGSAVRTAEATSESAAAAGEVADEPTGRAFARW